MPANHTPKKPRMSIEHRIRRRNQIIILVFSVFIILTMLLSLVKF
jgi:hypothetical protein